ncbi:hypothetical protein AB0M29_38850 [Streptomyces sp. NPDC051976]|uniref:hypothetical protein n=1 Tax=Streptomyces sp. NPDC051976 TaxID=3154947 RepID=UPI0034302644
MATTLDRLRERGLTGQDFWRFGRSGLQSLFDAVGNPRKDAAQARQRAEDDRRAAEYKAEREREREERWPRCANCAEKFTDQRWTEVDKRGRANADSHRTLCAGCKQQAIEAEKARKAAKN